MVDFILNEEQQEYQKLAREFAQRQLAPNAHKCDAAAEPAVDLLQQAWNSGLLNVQLPADFGGLGLGCWDAAIIAEELASGCPGISAPVEVNSIALVLIAAAAQNALRERIMKRLADEFALLGFPCGLFNEPSQRPVLTVTKKADAFVLNGELELVGNGSLAKWFIVAATAQGICSLFVVAHDADGVKAGEKPFMLGRRAADVRKVTFTDVLVKKEDLLGSEDGGEEVLAMSRAAALTIMSAGAVGLARTAMEHAIRYSKERHTFGKPIAEHQAVAFMLADMAKDIEAARLLTWQAAAAIDRGVMDSAFAFTARSFSQTMAMRVATDAVQVYGGYGYSKEYPVEKSMRDAKMFQLEDGTTAALNTELGKRLLTVPSR